MASGIDKPERGMPPDNDPEFDKALEGEDCVELKKPRKKPEDHTDPINWDKALEDADVVEVNKADPDWDGALENEDCVAVKMLLEKHRMRLVRGWNSDDKSLKEEGDVLEKLLNEGSKQDVKAQKLKPGTNEGFKKTVKAWQELKVTLTGRTALHVAARRGDRKLLEFIVSEILHVGGKCLAQYSCHVLEVIDSDYELDALAMAVASGNPEIVNLLMKTSRDCEFNPYYIAAPREEDSEEDGHSKDALSKEDPEPGPELMEGILKRITKAVSGPEDMECILKRITKVVLEALATSKAQIVRALYAKDCDFNFNSLEVYLFHFTFSTWKSNTAREGAIEPVRKGILSMVSKEESKDLLLRYLFLDLKDGQGRTPLHVAVDSNRVKEFCNLLHDGGNEDSIDVDLVKDIMNAEDAAGRTPLYRAAAKNQPLAVSELLKEDGVSVNAEITYGENQWGTCLDLDKLSWKNGFKSDCAYVRARMKAFKKKENAQGGPGPSVKPLGKVSSTALHVAIILKHEDIVKRIVHKLLKNIKYTEDVACHRQFTRPAAFRKESTSSFALRFYKVSTMKLAVLVGSVGIVQTLLKAEELKPALFTSKSDEKDYPTFHMAAALGNPAMVKSFLDSKKGHFDHTIVDWRGNTALHHAARGKYVKVHPHLVDFVGCSHVFISRWNRDDLKSGWLAKSQGKREMRNVLESNENPRVEDRYGQRMGCINLLLQAGVNIWEVNDMHNTPSPEAHAQEEFVKWWYQKVAKATEQAQKKLNDAANAISVTAALVATASYVGPLQPPLSYDHNSLQTNILEVRIFIVCNSLSFYLALGAIMLSLLPALSSPKESMFKEQVQSRIFVGVAVIIFLFPSIVFVILAFAAAYIAGSPENGLAHHGLTVATTLVGGGFCLLAMITFSRRVLTVFGDLPPSVRRDICGFFKEFFLIEKLVDLVSRKAREDKSPLVDPIVGL